MNRHFSDYEGREFPRRSYGKIEQVEPLVVSDAADAFFAFEAVDASWDGFQNGLLALDGTGTAAREQYWENRFSGLGELPGEDPYEGMPIYRIEFTLKAGSSWLKDVALDEESWFDIELDTAGEVPVEVYASLFGPPIQAWLKQYPRKSSQSESLNQVFDEINWPDTKKTSLDYVLPDPCTPDMLVCLDVGQGSAFSICCRSGAHYYFDVGCGVYGNAKTRPSKITFCTCIDPKIILSHWDKDHWAGAIQDKSLLSHTWIVPRQKGLPAGHIAFANSILAAGGHIHVLARTLCPYVWTSGIQDFKLEACTGSTRNGSGLALIVTDSSTLFSWLLTGDAGYNEIPAQLPPLEIVALSVPHHGADMTKLGTAPNPSARSAYKRALYSFGPGNKNGSTGIQHPVAASVKDHNSQGWGAGSWVGRATPAQVIAGGDTLATATHTATHNDGAAAGFSAAPALGSLHICSNSMPVSQT